MIKTNKIKSSSYYDDFAKLNKDRIGMKVMTPMGEMSGKSVVLSSSRYAQVSGGNVNISTISRRNDADEVLTLDKKELKLLVSLV